MEVLDYWEMTLSAFGQPPCDSMASEVGTTGEDEGIDGPADPIGTTINALCIRLSSLLSNENWVGSALMWRVTENSLDDYFAL
jgi:hypothetical protein